MSMPLATILVLGTLAAMVGLPGWLVHRLSGKELSWREGAALVGAGLSVLFSNAGALAGYHLSLMLALNVAIIITLGGAIWLRRGKLLPDPPPSKLAILYQLFIFGFFLAPAFVLYLPYDTDAQGFGYLALMVREGGTVDTLAPWQPDVRYLYSPTFFIWSAYLSDLLELPLHQVMLPLAHIAAGLMALLGIDMGRALSPDRPRVAWLIPLTMLGGFGLFTTVMDSAYTSVLGLLFAVLFLTLVFRSKLLAALALAAVPLTHPDTTIILLLGYIPFFGTFWLSQKGANWATWLRLFVWIPGMALLLTIPWLARVWALFWHTEIVSPFGLSLSHTEQLIAFNGVLVPVLALLGALIGVRRRLPADVLALTWLVCIADFSLFGLVDMLASRIGLDLMRYVYPFSVAWHGPIIPYAYLAALALDEGLARLVSSGYPITSDMVKYRYQYFRLTRRISSGHLIAGLLVGGMGMLILAVALSGSIIQASKPMVQIYGTFASEADLAATAYLRQHAPGDALILNYPGGFEGHWVPVLAERESVFFREQPFFAGAERYYERMQTLSSVYYDLAGPGAHEALQRYGVTHVVIPQIVGEPEAFSEMQRWRRPEETWYPLSLSLEEIEWLELMFEQDGAQVYRVKP